MSAPVSEYLAATVLSHLRSNPPKPGKRYHFHVERREDVEKLFSAFSWQADQPFVFNEYESATIEFGGIRLILAASHNATESFLTHLRNETADQKDLFEGCSLLLVHDTALDSILGGAENLGREGGPMHVDVFRRRLAEDIRTLDLHQSETEALLCILADFNSSVHEDSSSIFAYRPFMEIIQKGRVETHDWNELGLFPDPELIGITSAAQLQKRVADNRKWHDTVLNSHRYGDPADDLERDFTRAGISELKKPTWSEVSYGQVWKWHDERANAKPPTYVDSGHVTEEGLTVWERPGGDSAAGKRKRHIVIFNPDGGPVQHVLHFDRRIHQSAVKMASSCPILAVASGKSLRLMIPECGTDAVIGRVRYNDPEATGQYEFNIAVVPFLPSLINSQKGAFEVNGKGKAGGLRLQTEGLLVFNEACDHEERVMLGPGSTVTVPDDTKLVAEVEYGDKEEETLCFSLCVGGTTTACEISRDVPKPVIVTGANIWKWKREQKRSFEFVGENKLIFGNAEYFTSRVRTLRFLQLEQAIVNGHPLDCSWMEDKTGLTPRHLDVDAELKEHFSRLLAFYRERRLLPSLTSVDERPELLGLMEDYVTRYRELLGEVEEGKPLRLCEHSLLRIGAIEHDDGESQFFLTPLHPLNVAFQLEVRRVLGSEELPNEVLACLSPRDLLPFMNGPAGPHQKLRPVMETELAEWTVYRPCGTTHQGWQNDFIHRLVADKIKEYIRHFPYVSTGTVDGPIRINLVNLGNCVDALKGVIRFFQSQLEASAGEARLIPAIRVCAYGPEAGCNRFAEFALYSNPDEIVRDFEIDLKYKGLEAAYVLQVIREKLRFYVKGKDCNYEYAHLTFFRFEGKSIQWSYQQMSSMPTGAVLGGLLNAVPSVFTRHQYMTGFGARHTPEDVTDLVDLARRLNALARVVNTKDPYSPSEAIFSVVPDNAQSGLDQLYDASNWVTFIEPGVDLNFFKDSEDGNDLVIIHYSDQYNNTSGYDAITVTRKSQQYCAILREFATDQGIDPDEIDERGLIGMFNAINGDWLLRLISGRAHFPREKVSILSAVKAMVALLMHDDFLWVPLSLEEVLRVSGSVGLPQSEGLFSKKNLGLAGAYCDDLLMVGLEPGQARPRLHFLPVEVKIGQVTEAVFEKGKEQGAKTAAALREFLAPATDTFRARFYRAFFAKLTIIAAQKFQLYGLIPEQNWAMITDEFRCQLLNDDFELAWDLGTCLGESVFFAFDSNAFKRSVTRVDSCLRMDLLETDGAGNLGKSVAELHEFFLDPSTTIDEARMLCNCYRPPTPPEADGVSEDDGTPPPQPPDDGGADGGDAATGGTANGAGVGAPATTVGMSILFGHDVNTDKPVLWHPNDTDKVMHPNTGIIGTMGTGKTQFTKSLVTQLVQRSADNVNGTKLGFLIFDYKGDYIKDDFLEATGAKRFDLHRLPYNPLALTLSESPIHKLPLHTANAIKESICTAYQATGAKQKFRLRKAIMAAYERAGIDPDDATTWTRVAPTLQDVCNVFFNEEKLEEDSLFAAMDGVLEFEIFEPDASKTVSLWELLDGVVVINLSGYDQNIQNLVVAITLDQFYMQMQKAGHSAIRGNLRELRKMVLVDEADNFLSQGFDAIRRILKEGREFGVGTILSTQFLRHFSASGSEYANYILSWVVHQVTDISLKTVPVVFGAQEKGTAIKLVAEGTKLKKHFSLANIGDGAPMLMRDRAFWEIVSGSQ